MTAASTRSMPLYGAALAAVLAVCAGVALAPNGVEGAHLAARYTARVAFLVFVVVYLASSLPTLWPGDLTRGLLRNRRAWGLGFALAHSVHLCALVTYLNMIGQPPSALTLVGGGLAYGLMFAMAATSNDGVMRRMGRWWRRLHSVGIHWLWIVFAFTYLGRLSDPERAAQGAVLLPVALAALALRLAAWWVRRQRGQQAARLRAAE